MRMWWASAGVALVGAMSLSWLQAQRGGAAPVAPGATVAIDPDDIGGTVTSAKGPEAGVWVIAETH